MKKWSYATALMLSLAGGGMLTGCIDNDEPYGIKEVRLAMASFLESQKAVAEADAAAKKAEAEVSKIKAEIAKIDAETAQKKAEAEAKINEAKAQAEIDKAKAELEAYLAQQQAILDRYIAETQDIVNNANLLYEKAVYAWEQQKAKDAATAQDDLYKAVAAQYEIYLEELKGYNGLNARLLKAQQEYARYANDLVWDDEKQQFVCSPAYDLKKFYTDEVAKYEKKIANKQAKIAELTAFGEQLQGITKSELYTMLEEYQAEADANTVALQKAEVEKETLEFENKSKREAAIAANQEVNEIGNQEIAIPAYKIPAYANIPGFETEIEIVPENVVYSYYSDWYYNLYKSEYERQIVNIKNTLLDDNDKAWTAARIEEMKRQLTSENTVNDQNVANWNIAKKAYNGGKTPDASVLPNEAAVEDAIAKYATAAASLSEKRPDRDSKQEAYGEAVAAYWEAVNAYPQDPNSVLGKYNAALKKCEADVQAADDAYSDAEEAARKTKEQALKDAQVKKDNAWNAYYRAQDAANAATYQSNLDPENEALKTAAKSAQKEADDALAAAQKADQQYTKDVSAANNAYNKAVAEAKTAKVKAENAANEAKDKAYAAYVAAGGDNSDIDPTVIAALNAKNKAEEASNKAQEAFEKASDSVSEAYEKVGESINKQISGIEELGYYGWNISSYEGALSQIENYISGGIDKLPEIVAPALYQENKVYANVKNLLVSVSNKAYGYLTTYDFNDNNYNGFLADEAFLVDEVTPKMINDYIVAYGKHYGWEIEPYQYYLYYNMFGSYGETLYLDNRIKTGEEYLANTDDVNAIAKDLEDNLAALEKSYNDQEAALEAAQKVAEQKWEEYNDVFTEIQATIDDLQDYDGIYSNILGKLKTAIVEVSNLDLPADAQLADFNSIKTAISENAEEIARQEKLIAKAQEALDKAKYQLDAFNSGKADYNVNPYEIQVNDLKAEIEVAKAELELHKARLDELQAQYEAASKDAE